MILIRTDGNRNCGYVFRTENGCYVKAKHIMWICTWLTRGDLIQIVSSSLVHMENTHFGVQNKIRSQVMQIEFQSTFTRHYTQAIFQLKRMLSWALSHQIIRFQGYCAICRIRVKISIIIVLFGDKIAWFCTCGFVAFGHHWFPCVTAHEKWQSKVYTFFLSTFF